MFYWTQLNAKSRNDLKDLKDLTYAQWSTNNRSCWLSQSAHDWSSQSAFWLVDPECLLIGWARVPPDWPSYSWSWLVNLWYLLIDQASIFSNIKQTDIQTDIQTRVISRDASASKKQGWLLQFSAIQKCPLTFLPEYSKFISVLSVKEVNGHFWIVLYPLWNK